MLESTMPGRRSHRLHLGMTTPEEVAAYIEAFLMAFSQVRRFSRVMVQCIVAVSGYPGLPSVVRNLILGKAVACAILLYATCFSVCTQGSADAFGRLSKVRSELKELLWTHPSGSQAGIADALEYLNQVHQKFMIANPCLLFSPGRTHSGSANVGQV